MRRLSKTPPDPQQAGALILRASTEAAGKPNEKPEVLRYLSQIGSRGGKKGGKARAAVLSAKQRKEIAQKAANARWSVEK